MQIPRLYKTKHFRIFCEYAIKSSVTKYIENMSVKIPLAQQISQTITT